MATGICTPCNTDDITTYPIPCNLITSSRKSGILQPFLLKCDKTITDLTDDVEWAALKASGDIIVFPQGSGNLITPETTTEQLVACSPEVVIDEIGGFDFATKLFDNDTYLDFQFEYDLKNLYNSYTIMWLGCDGILYYDYNWTPGTNPGFSNFVPTVFRSGETVQALNINVRFKTYGTNLKGFKPNTAVMNAIFN